RRRAQRSRPADRRRSHGAGPGLGSPAHGGGGHRPAEPRPLRHRRFGRRSPAPAARGRRRMKALTGNRLADGEAVFWKDGRWVERFAEATLFDDEALAAEAEGAAKAQGTVVVDPYL